MNAAIHAAVLILPRPVQMSAMKTFNDKLISSAFDWDILTNANELAASYLLKTT